MFGRDFKTSGVGRLCKPLGDSDQQKVFDVGKTYVTICSSQIQNTDNPLFNEFTKNIDKTSQRKTTPFLSFLFLTDFGYFLGFRQLLGCFIFKKKIWVILFFYPIFKRKHPQILLAKRAFETPLCNPPPRAFAFDQLCITF